MKWTRTYVALTLVFLFVPGAVEATENVVHLVAHGDLAHASHNASHRETGSEHDCSGLFHSCVCHSTILITGPLGGALLPVPPPRTGQLWLTHIDRTASGYPDALYRPPAV